DLSIAANDLAAGSVTFGAVGTSKIASCSVDGQILKYTAATGWTCQADNNTTYSGTSFATSSQNCPAGQKATGVNGSGALVCSSVGSADLASGAVSGGLGGVVTDLSITAADIADTTITFGKLANCANTEVLKWKTGTGWTCSVDRYAYGVPGTQCPSTETAFGYRWAPRTCTGTPSGSCTVEECTTAELDWAPALPPAPQCNYRNWADLGYGCEIISTMTCTANARYVLCGKE
ncbi:MAG: hypothetical protein HY903_20595, partial [Deltaproteobacteria bacterium]|nr:hypothetical protein [Deltaproteobacteria bacterium]